MTTPDTVARLRSLARTRSLKACAEVMGLNACYVRQLASANGIKPGVRRNGHSIEWPDDQVIEALELYNSGYTFAEASHKTGIPESTISAYWNLRSRPELGRRVRFGGCS